MQLMGFDAHRFDPLGGLDLVEADFAWATARLMEIAEKHAKGRIGLVLERAYYTCCVEPRSRPLWSATGR